MLATIEVTNKITFDFDGDIAKLKASEVSMAMSKNMDIEQYFDENQNPNKAGCKAITQALVIGLGGNIHLAHAWGYLDSAKHLRSTISQLEDIFVINPDLGLVKKEVDNG